MHHSLSDGNGCLQFASEFGRILYNDSSYEHGVSMNRSFGQLIKSFSLHEFPALFKEAVKEKDVLLIVVPSNFFRDIFTKLSSFISPSAYIVVGTKGIENDSLMTMSQVIKSVINDKTENNIACISGPSFAREVCFKHPTAVTIASKNTEMAISLQEIFSTDSTYQKDASGKIYEKYHKTSVLH